MCSLIYRDRVSHACMCVAIDIAQAAPLIAEINLYRINSHRHQAEVTAGHLLARFCTTSESFLKPESLISTEEVDPSSHQIVMPVAHTDDSVGNWSTSVYANSWYVSLPRPHPPPANSRFVQGGGGSRHLAPPSKWCREHHSSRGGWQTPDSGAGSCSTTNEVTGQHAPGQHAGGPPPFAHAIQPAEFFNSAASESSASSLGGAQMLGGAWNRMKEMKLRQILDQIIWERTLVRNTNVDLLPCVDTKQAVHNGVNPSDFTCAKSYVPTVSWFFPFQMI